MIIYRDSLLELTFDPRSDILSAKWFNLIDESYPQIQHSLTEVIDSINHYFVTKLLIDTQSTFSNVPDHEYQSLTMKMARDLATTQLKKVARIVSENYLTEARIKEYNQEIEAQVSFNFKSQEFKDKESAWQWLAKDED